MDLFPISDLQRFSGIKAHTIRIWEQRYNTLQPNRSDGNTRYYSGDQLRRLLNIVSLLHVGYKISDLSVMSDDQLWKLLQELSENAVQQDPVHEYFITQMVAAGMEFNEEYLEKLFAGCILRFGMKQTYIAVIYPLLVRIGSMWSRNLIPPAQEHFISNLLKQKLNVAIDALPPVKDQSNSWLLFLPEDEYHEISLLFAYYLVKQAGKKVIYLGASTSLEALQSTAEVMKPENMLFFQVNYANSTFTQTYLTKLSKMFPSVHIYMAGNEKLISMLERPKNLSWIKSVPELESILK